MKKTEVFYKVDKNFIFTFYTFFILSLALNGQEKDSIYFRLNQIYSLKDYEKVIFQGTKELKKTKLKEEASLQFLLGKSFFNLNKEDSAFVYFKKALKNYKALGVMDSVAEVNYRVSYLLRSQKSLDVDHKLYFNEFYGYAKQTGNKELLAKANYSLGVMNYWDKDPYMPKDYFKKAYELYKEINDVQGQIDQLSNIGAMYVSRIKERDSARYYFYKALSLYEKDTSKKKDPNTKFNLYNNIGNSYKYEKDYTNALLYFKKAEAIELDKWNIKSRRILYSNLQATYYYDKQYKNAYTYLYKYDSVKNVIALEKQNANISEIQEKYDNEKLRADNLEIADKQKQNKNLFIGAASLSVLAVFIGFLVYKNTKKKQLLAEQGKTLQEQKVTNLLKEQELLTIDAMISGQEKERLRIANDLHDNLGALMSTVKLHFNAIQENNGKEATNKKLFAKTNQLLDNAYKKIREMAHAKNSGVIAKDGLLAGVKRMARTISASGQLKISVFHFGLENRLENSLELTLFRIVQELTTNIIKHANAKEANIHLTNHDNMLNIMVEDDGCGFDTESITLKQGGMGLKSIDHRIEKLNGKMQIESKKDKGTTIIIDIPV